MKFKFSITKIVNANPSLNEKIVYVDTMVTDLHQNKTTGNIRVRFNDHGIFPVPEDIASFTSQLSLRRLVAVELKRYIKPQKRWLEPD
ncbi:hypothetical protein [Bacillus sp. FJAT-27251]|uniref:hypothetical protein n=1 Tax=Bacillus sp. FJAT-27251 TaxID=1684142 RepID=UPI000840B90A|nr:hypothetical protein [Bacillus sp. FJAT-27251]